MTHTIKKQIYYNLYSIFPARSLDPIRPLHATWVIAVLGSGESIATDWIDIQDKCIDIWLKVSGTFTIKALDILTAWISFWLQLTLNVHTDCVRRNDLLVPHFHQMDRWLKTCRLFYWAYLRIHRTFSGRMEDFQVYCLDNLGMIHLESWKVRSYQSKYHHMVPSHRISLIQLPTNQL